MTKAKLFTPFEVPPLGGGGGSDCIFVTGIGTGIGKTLVSAIIVEALQAGYWKPIQAGLGEDSDNETVKKLISNTSSVLYGETYKFKMPASPHIAARQENKRIDLQVITDHYKNITSETLVIEGAGGLMVPLNEKDFIIDLIELLQAKVILISRNYLGSINHSLLTSAVCKQRKLDVAGWIFNDQYLEYEDEIVEWSGYPKIASIPFTKNITSSFVAEQACIIRKNLLQHL